MYLCSSVMQNTFAAIDVVQIWLGFGGMGRFMGGLGK